MKKNFVLLMAILISLWFSSCGGAKRPGMNDKSSDAYLEESSKTTVSENAAEEAESPSSTEQITNASLPISSSAAKISKFDSLRKIIRNAELKFKSKNVVNSSYIIEDIVSHFNGYISSSEIQNEISRIERTPFSDDSAVKSTYYVITAEIVARVPKSNLDSTLKAMTPLIDFLDYRKIKTQDLTLDFLRQELQKKRQELYQNRVGGVTNSSQGSTGDKVAAQDKILNSQIAADEAMIQNLETNDKIAYSQINISMYQEEMIKTEKVAEQYHGGFFKPGFSYRMKQAFLSGWNIFRFIIYFFVTLWPLILIAAVVWYLIILIRIKRKRKNNG